MGVRLRGPATLGGAQPRYVVCGQALLGLLQALEADEQILVPALVHLPRRRSRLWRRVQPLWLEVRPGAVRNARARAGLEPVRREEQVQRCLVQGFLMCVKPYVKGRY